MALRLIQIRLPDADYDSISEMIVDRSSVTTWADHRAHGQLIVQLIAPAEECEAIMDKFEQRFRSTPGFHILLLSIEAALPRLPEEEEEDETTQADETNGNSKGKHRVSREELYAEIKEGIKIGPVFYGHGSSFFGGGRHRFTPQ